VAAALAKDTRAALALACAALLWSGNFIAGRALRDDIAPTTLNLLRWSLCLVIFLPWVGPKVWRHRHVVLREWRLLLALGATGIATFHTLVYVALTTTSAINALLILSLSPATILIGSAFTGSGRPSRVQWVGTVVSLLGALVLLTRGNPEALLRLTPSPGDLWMLAAVVMWSAYSLLLRRRPVDLPQDVALAASIAPAIALPLPVVALSADAAPVVWTHSLFGALLYIAVCASLVAFLLWSYGVSAIGPERAGQYVHLMPVFGAVLAVALLDEIVVMPQVAGALCVFAGIALVHRRPVVRVAGIPPPKTSGGARSSKQSVE